MINDAKRLEHGINQMLASGHLAPLARIHAVATKVMIEKLVRYIREGR